MNLAGTSFVILAVAAQTISALDFFPPFPINLLTIGNNRYNALWGSTVQTKNLAKSSDSLSRAKSDPGPLSRDVTPDLYKIRLDIPSNLESCTGSVDIDISSHQKTNEITLHASKGSLLDHSSAYVSAYKKPHSYVTDVKYTDNDRVILRLSNSLPASKHFTVHLNFSCGPHLYSTSFKNSDDKSTSQIAVTRLVKRSKSTSLLFPCFNEPSMKGQFVLEISHDLKYTALSSMPIESVKHQNTKKLTTFVGSPRMSPHLVTIAIFDNLELRSNRSRKSQVWARHGTDMINTADIAEKAVSEMENFTKTKLYPFKIDHVAVPHGLVSSTEGGWGLLLYKEEDLTVGKNPAVGTRQRITFTISQAVASEWFGGMVTADSWNYYWLDEGFSKFFGNHLSEKMGHEAWNHFLVNELQDTMFADTHPTWSKPLTSSEGYSFYGSIPPNKGAAFLRMVTELLSMDEFQEAMKKYAFNNALKSVTPENLFEILEEAYKQIYDSKVDFKDFAKSWTEQAGFPLVTVTRNYETGEVSITQQKFFEQKPEDDTAAHARWWIPLSWMTENETVDFTTQKWLRADTESETIKIPPGESSFLLNLRSVGYFRVNYDSNNWLRLAKDMRTTPKRFSVANRAQIIDDAHALTKAGYVKITVALEILRLLENEEDPFVWTTGIKVLLHIKENVGGTEVYTLLEKFIQQLIKLAYSTVSGLSLSNPDEKYQKTLLRSLVAHLACASGVEQCTHDASDNFEKHKNDLSSIHPEEVFPTFCGVFKNADEKKFRDLRTLITNDDTPQNFKILRALAHCTGDKLLVKAYLADLFSAKGALFKNVKQSVDAAVLVSSSPLHSDTYFEFLKENIEELFRILKHDASRLVISLADGVKTRTQYEKVHAWVKDVYVKKSGDDRILEFLEKMPPTAIAWNERHLTEVKNWISYLLFPGTFTTPSPDHTTLYTDDTTRHTDRTLPDLNVSTTEEAFGVNGHNARCSRVAFWGFPFVGAFLVLWKVL